MNPSPSPTPSTRSRSRVRRTELGLLILVILKGQHISIERGDPFVVARLGSETTDQDDSENSGTTRTDPQGGQHPFWDEEFRFRVYDDQEADQMLTLTLMSRGTRGATQDESIASASVVADGKSWQEFDEWIEFRTPEGKYAGEAYVEMTFYPANVPVGPKLAELQRHPSKLLPASLLPVQGRNSRNNSSTRPDELATTFSSLSISTNDDSDRNYYVRSVLEPDANGLLPFPGDPDPPTPLASTSSVVETSGMGSHGIGHLRPYPEGPARLTSSPSRLSTSPFQHPSRSPSPQYKTPYEHRPSSSLSVPDRATQPVYQSPSQDGRSLYERPLSALSTSSATVTLQVPPPIPPRPQSTVSTASNHIRESFATVSSATGPSESDLVAQREREREEEEAARIERARVAEAHKLARIESARLAKAQRIEQERLDAQFAYEQEQAELERVRLERELAMKQDEEYIRKLQEQEREREERERRDEEFVKRLREEEEQERIRREQEDEALGRRLVEEENKLARERLVQDERLARSLAQRANDEFGT
ncbi:uncharacterized protein JCM15063_001428 [Sporobolomyces koalae]|uniref:uncharacterized protein n=1 Tax=Sporobolomyces koalae TaxID=500713 RepID=UPI0031804A01